MRTSFNGGLLLLLIGLLDAAADRRSDPTAGPAAESVERQRGFAGPLVLTGGGGVALQWQLKTLDGRAGVVFRFDSLQPCAWAAIGLGTGMAGAHSYVAWRDSSGNLRFDAYFMRSFSASGLVRTTAPSSTLPSSPFSRGRAAASPPAAEAAGNAASAASTGGNNSSSSLSSSVAAAGEEFEDVRLQSARTSKDGQGISATFWRPLAATGPPGMTPTIDPSGATSFIWALGTTPWVDPPRSSAFHTAWASRPTQLELSSGAAAAGAAARPARTLVAHALLMTIAYAGLVPLAVACARYLRAGGVVKVPRWFHLHRAAAVLAVAAALAGVACALAYQQERRGTVKPLTEHSKLGVAAIVLLCAQPLNAALRPHHPDPRARRARAPWLTRRFAWLVFHRSTAAAALAVAIAALFTGLKLSCTAGIDRCEDLRRALIFWLASLGAYAVLREAVPILTSLLCRRRHRGGSCCPGAGWPLPTPAVMEAAAGAPIAAAEGSSHLLKGSKTQFTDAASGGAKVVADEQPHHHSATSSSVGFVLLPPEERAAGGGGAAAALPRTAQSSADPSTSVIISSDVVGSPPAAAAEDAARFQQLARVQACERRWAALFAAWLVVTIPIAVLMAAGHIGSAGGGASDDGLSPLLAAATAATAAAAMPASTGRL